MIEREQSWFSFKSFYSFPKSLSPPSFYPFLLFDALYSFPSSEITVDRPFPEYCVSGVFTMSFLRFWAQIMIT